MKHVQIASFDALRHLKNKLVKISLEKVGGLELLGQPLGENLEHCLFMGIKYSPDFERRVKYYAELSKIDQTDPRYEMKKILEESFDKRMLAVNFYGERNGKTR